MPRRSEYIELAPCTASKIPRTPEDWFCVLESSVARCGRFEVLFELTEIKLSVSGYSQVTGM